MKGVYYVNSSEKTVVNETSGLSQKKFGMDYSLQLNNRAQLKVIHV